MPPTVDHTQPPTITFGFTSPPAVSHDQAMLHFKVAPYSPDVLTPGVYQKVGEIYFQSTGVKRQLKALFYFSADDHTFSYDLDYLVPHGSVDLGTMNGVLAPTKPTVVQADRL